MSHSFPATALPTESRSQASFNKERQAGNRRSWPFRFLRPIWQAREPCLPIRDGQSGWFGPRWTVSVNVADSRSPRKTCVFRELGHIRLKWFAPHRPEVVTGYEVHRATASACHSRGLLRYTARITATTFP